MFVQSCFLVLVVAGGIHEISSYLRGSTDRQRRHVPHPRLLQNMLKSCNHVPTASAPGRPWNSHVSRVFVWVDSLSHHGFTLFRWQFLGWSCASNFLYSIHCSSIANAGWFLSAPLLRSSVNLIVYPDRSTGTHASTLWLVALFAY